MKTVSIGIPAYNEEVNISNILKQILLQKGNNFKLNSVKVYSDGSIDDTNRIVKEISEKNKLVSLVNGQKRKGKLFRLNQMFANCSDEILIILDADIGIVGDDFLERMISYLIKDKNAVIVSAHQVPICPNSLFGKLVYHSFLTWDFIREGIPDHNHVQNFYGAATAYRSSFTKKLHIPEGVREERIYLYLMAKKVEGFRNAKDAKILYWPVSILKDFLGISRRSFGEDEMVLNNLFGFDVNKITRVPTRYKIAGLAKAFIKKPLITPLAVFLNLYLGVLRPKKRLDKNSLWEMSLSTKKPILSDKYV